MGGIVGVRCAKKNKHLSWRLITTPIAVLVTVLSSLLAPPSASTDPVDPADPVDQLEHQEQPPTIHPGSKIGYRAPDGLSETCTAGFLVTTSTPTPAFLTAGHCAPMVGKPVYVVPPDDGTPREVGYIRVVAYSGSNSNDADIALVDMGLDTVLKSSTFLNGISVTGVSPAEALKERRPQLCKQGQMSGLTCGPITGFLGEKVLFRAPSDHGDSGAPIVAAWEDGSYTAVGILDGSPVGDNGTIIAQLISPWMAAWALRLAR